MRLKFTFIAVLFTALNAFSQSKNAISLIYSTGGSTIDHYNATGAGFEMDNSTAFGLSYTRHVYKHISIETGLNFSNNKIKLYSFSDDVGYSTIKRDQIRLVTVPIMGRFTFFKYVYTGLGLNVDIQTNHTDTSIAPNQSGIGLQGDVGGNYSFGEVTVSAGIFYRRHGLINFTSGSNQNLLDGGFKFGVGYNF